MNDEERRNSLASIAAGGGPSIELDTIDNLAHPTACNLILLVERSLASTGVGVNLQSSWERASVSMSDHA
jgi:hypothetical protein